MCRVLGVSRSGYYDWLDRAQSPPSGRSAGDLVLLDQIKAVHAEFGFYGAPRVHRTLVTGGHRVGRRRVARLMRLHGIRARRGKIKSRPRTAPPVRRPEIRDLVRRNFTAPGPDRLWFTDLTMIATGEGFLRAAVVLDAFSRAVISWTCNNHETPDTAITALAEAIRLRRPAPGCVIHSDRGYQFTSHDWADLAHRHNLEISIGERKSALDYACMESWFASLKKEEIYPHGRPATRAEARTRLFKYIWKYNNKRLHSSLGYLTPTDYATIDHTQLATCP